ncbi:MAG: PASTA domain-containing protein [Fimbriimonadaceae bacterium]|nr:PASTA domain-containing protein [Fimbriimonadaceae bacterium]
MIGTVLGGRYEVLQEAEEGPIFASYRARDRVANREVRLRIVTQGLGDDVEFTSGLKTIVERLQVITHPGVERIYQWEGTNRPPFLVCEHFAGVTLEDRLRRLSSFSVSVTLATVIQVAEAVSALHQAGFAHGDICPANVICTPQDTIKLALGGLWEAYARSERAGKAVLRGMAPSMAPELNTGTLPNQRTDIYALGVMLYEMLSGRKPFPGDSTMAIAAKHASGDVISLRQLNSSVPAALDDVVRRCISKNPFDRYNSVDQLLGDLKMLHENLRFGRPLAWPTKPNAVEEEPPPVAPTMSVVNPKPDPKNAAAERKRQRKERSRDGVPGWLAFIAIFTTLLGLAAVGGWWAFNQNKPPLVDVPNIVGKNVTEAASELKKSGLTLKQVREDYNDKFGKGTIISSDPAAGRERAREGSTVYVVVSRGGLTVEVPDLKGKTVAQARALLAEVNLVLDENPTRVRSTDVGEGKIVNQNPSAGVQISRDSRINVRVSAGNRNVPTGRSTERFLYRVAFTLPEGDSPILVRIEMTDDRETNTVLEEEREPGDRVEVEAEGVGAQATFRVYYNDELKGTKTVKAETEVTR